MKTEINDGGPAFPLLISHPILQTIEAAEKGMTLRDWFAGMALQGYVAHFGNDTHHEKLETDDHTWAEWKSQSMDVVELCYDYADSMIAQRSKK